MIKTSEVFDSARSEYIEGYEEKNKFIFPTLALVAKEFNVSFSTSGASGIELCGIKLDNNFY